MATTAIALLMPRTCKLFIAKMCMPVCRAMPVRTAMITVAPQPEASHIVHARAHARIRTGGLLGKAWGVSTCMEYRDVQRPAANPASGSS